MDSLANAVNKNYGLILVPEVKLLNIVAQVILSFGYKVRS